jgi:SAM-dependent methyltransferase
LGERHIDARLYRYGLRLGLDALRRRRIRDAARYLIRPVNYWRSIEYELIWDHAAFRPRMSVLDVGSPKLLSLYLSDRGRCHVTATDIDPYFIESQLQLQRSRRIPPERLQCRVEDGRALSFASNTFDVAYALSVVEHIPGDGDSQCMAEMGRVVAPGGTVVVTVPFAPTYREEHHAAGDFYWSHASTRQDRLAFYQRRYDETALHRRLIDPSGMRLRVLRFIGERPLASRGREISDYLSVVTGPVDPLLSRLLHKGPVSDWRELDRPLCALIALGKDAEARDA